MQRTTLLSPLSLDLRGQQMPQNLSTLMETVRQEEVRRAQRPRATTILAILAFQSYSCHDLNRIETDLKSVGGGKGWNYLVMQVKTTQRMKIMSTRARQTINLWNVSLKSFLLRIIMLTTFPAVNRANSHSSVNYVLPIIPNIPISGTKYPSMIRPSGPSEFCSTHQAYQC